MLLQAFEQTIAQRHLLTAGSRGLCAFSGGPDSLCLLHLLARLRASWQIEITAVHVDHGLRAESVHEAEQARQKAEALGIEAITRHVRVATGPGRNLQESARLARRAILEEEARIRGADWVALGHNAQDQAETVLMRLVRGAGTAGLAGIAWRSGIFIRPLLGVTRVDVQRYLDAHGLCAIQDPSNATPRYLRNRIRRQVLPLLEQENPALVETVSRLAESCREDSEALEMIAGQELTRATTSDGDLALAQLADLPTGLQHRVLRLAYARVTGSSRRLERKHLLALAEMAERTDGTSFLDLPGVRAERRYARMRLWPHEERASSRSLAEFLVSGPGAVELGDGRVLELEVESAGGGGGDLEAGESPVTRLNAERARFPLTLRALRPGDRLRTAPEQSRKVARLLLDAKIPRRERSRVPVLLSGTEVLAVVGVRCDFEARAQPGLPQLLLRWRTAALERSDQPASGAESRCGEDDDVSPLATPR